MSGAFLCVFFFALAFCVAGAILASGVAFPGIVKLLDSIRKQEEDNPVSTEQFLASCCVLLLLALAFVLFALL